MTGQKNKYSTVEKLWSLNDTQLTTPKHDEMVLWLLNNKNIIACLPTIIPLNIKSEEPIFAPNKFLVGFSDILVEFFKFIDCFNLILDHSKNMFGAVNYNSIDSLEYLTIHDQNVNCIGIIIEHYEPEYPDYEDCYLLKDLTGTMKLINNTEWRYNINDFICVNGYYTCNGFEVIQMCYIYSIKNIITDKQLIKYELCIEVKPTISSFGETLRQLKTYQHYLKIENMYLFTSDLGFKTAFEHQEIIVIPYVP